MLTPTTELSQSFSPVSAAVAPIGLPAGAVLLERAADILRAWLNEHGREDWQVFYDARHTFHRIDEHLAAIDDRAKWMSIASLSGMGSAVDAVYIDSATERIRQFPPGVLLLARAQVVLARWNWQTTSSEWQILRLCAAPNIEAMETVRTRLIELGRETPKPQWQIHEASGWSDKSVDRDMHADDSLVLGDALRAAAETNMVQFFSDGVAAMYKSLSVPYRRGVLLYGPPGNGKTSLVRWLGCRLPNIPMMLLRAGAGFESDDLRELFRRWREQAPAVLVVEDLNWMFKQVELSTFLNLLDGVEQPTAGGLLLIGTTNHPYELDSAISDRPGRFDVTLEVPCPEASLREMFFRSRANAELTGDLLRDLVAATEGLSFAHLQEVVQRAGVAAMRDGRTQRNADDLLAAAKAVAGGHATAAAGFPRKPEMPFGLHHLHKRKP